MEPVARLIESVSHIFDRFSRKDVLACGLLAAVIWVVWALFHLKIPEVNQDALLMLLGALLMRLADVYGYEFGSSRSSQAKDDQLAVVTARALNALPIPPAAPTDIDPSAQPATPPDGPAGPVQEPPRG